MFSLFRRKPVPHRENYAASSEHGWTELGRPYAGKGGRRTAAEVREAARRLAADNPYARNALRVLESYVIGAGVTVTPRAGSSAKEIASGNSFPAAKDCADVAGSVWAEFFADAAPHVTPRELAVRLWRDGEVFLRLFPAPGRPPRVRFLDPEEVGPTAEHPDSHGVLTVPGDAETPTAYLRVDPATGDLVETVPADAVLHVKANVDANEPRGVSLLAPAVGVLERHAAWLDTELTARRLQASVVLWRRVAGGPAADFDGDPAAGLRFTAAGGSSTGGFAGAGAVGFAGAGRIAPGSILTTPETTDLEFLSPKSSFREASQLGRALLLEASAAVGLPEFMLTADASNANYASTLAAESPAVKRFAAEQRFLADALTRLWDRVQADAARRGLLPPDVRRRVRPDWTFPDVAFRDRAKERTADVALVDAGVLSRAEVARREGVEPADMRRESAEEAACS